MRILRGHSSTDVSYRGFALFVVGIIISTFLGGAIRTVLNSTSIQKRFLEEARKKWPELSIEIGKMQGQLSRGIWPGLVFKFNSVHLVKKSCSGDSIDVELLELMAPVKILSLWQGQPRLGEVEGRDLKVRIFKSPCALEEELHSKVESNSGVGAPVEPPQANPRMNLNWQPLRKVAEEISFNRIEITSEAEPNLKTIVTDFELELEDSLELKAELEIRKSLQFTTLSHRLSLQLEATDASAEARLRGKLKEGQLDWKILANLPKQTFYQELIIKQMPVKDVFAEMFKAGLTTHEFSPRSLWLNCRVSQSGNLTDWTAEPLSLKDCKLNGGIGTIEMAEGQLNLREKKFVKATNLKIENLQLAPLLEALGRDRLPAVFANLGAWSGRAQVTNEEDWKIDGALKGLEIIVSSQSVRGKQVVNSMKTELENAPSGVRGKISQIDFADGFSESEIAVQLDSKLKSGSINFDFKSILLSEGIQKLLVGGSLKNVAASGSGKLLNGELEALEGHATAERMQGKGWQLFNANLQVIFKNKVAAVKIKAKQFLSDPKWSQFLAFNSVYGEASKKQINWVEPMAQLIVTEKGGDLVLLMLKDLDHQLKLVAKGSWQRDRDFVGTLMATSERGRKSFSVLGREYQLSITPD